jgi:hypothetical protein
MCPPGAARTVPLERFLGPEQLNAVNSQNLCRISPRGKSSGPQQVLAGAGLADASEPIDRPLRSGSPGHNLPDARTIAPRYGGFNQHKR